MQLPAGRTQVAEHHTTRARQGVSPPAQGGGIFPLHWELGLASLLRMLVSR